MKQTHLFGLTNEKYCSFCKISKKEAFANIIFEDSQIISFLDNKPIFPGHCLVIPKIHIENFESTPLLIVHHVFEIVQKISKAVEIALKAEGTFIAINNKISQSVPHLHIHVVPRRYKDGLKGFFWPRHPYQSIEHIYEVQHLIIAELQK
jgi:histidine triad (HIT) family protein